MRSLRLRLLLPLAAGLALLLVLGGFLAHRAVRDALEGGIDATLEAQARWWADRLVLEVEPAYRREMEALGASALAELAEHPVEEALRKKLLSAAEAGVRVQLRDRATSRRTHAEERTRYAIRAGDGRLLAGSPPRPEAPGRRERVLRVEDVPFADPARQAAWARIRGQARLPAHTALVTVARDTEDVDRFLRTLATALVVLLAGFLTLGSLLAAAVVRRALSPLRELERQLRTLDASALDRRIRLDDCPTELGPVVDALNGQLARLEEAFARERRTTAHIAHELRTPRAELRSVAEVALAIPGDPDATRKSLEGCRDGAVHMTRIVETILRLARARAAPGPASTERVDLAAAVAESAEALAAEAARRRQTLAPRLPEGLAVRGDGEVLRTLLGGLLRNAIRHAPAGSTIRAEARREGRAVVLSLENPCEELDPADLPHLTEPFWRKDPARTSSDAGGLGLSLADALARAEGWTLAFALAGGVFAARVSFPDGAGVDAQAG